MAAAADENPILAGDVPVRDVSECPSRTFPKILMGAVMNFMLTSNQEVDHMPKAFFIIMNKMSTVDTNGMTHTYAVDSIGPVDKGVSEIHAMNGHSVKMAAPTAEKIRPKMPDNESSDIMIVAICKDGVWLKRVELVEIGILLWIAKLKGM